MFKKFFKNIGLRTAKTGLENYLEKVREGNSEQHGMILAHHCMLLAQIVKKNPVISVLM